MAGKLTAAFLTSILAATLVCSAEEPAKISILQTTDLHGFILQNEESPGVLKLASLIRKEYVSGKTLLVDCGDSFEGSFEDAATEGEIMLPVFNALPYDAWIPGNHDFDWGLKCLAELAGKLKCQKLAANLAVDGKPLEPFVAWSAFTRNGVSIAVIGMSSPYLDRWLWGGNVAGLKAQSLSESLDRIMPEVLRSKPDIIIMAVHGGKFATERLGGDDGHLFAIARRHPEIDIVLGGHSHQKEPGERLGQTTWFAQAGQHGEALLRIDIDFDLGKRRIAKLESKILSPEGQEPDPQLSSELKGQLEAIDKSGAAIIGKLDASYGPRGKRKGAENTLALLICQAIAEAADAKIAFHGVHSQASFGPGEISEKTLNRIIPYENRVGALWLTPSQCRQIIEEQAALEDKARRMTAWGLEFKLSKDGKVEGPLKLAGGAEWSDETARIKAAFSGYDLASSGGRLPALAAIAEDKSCKAQDAGMTTREALRKALSKTLGK